VGCSLVAEPRLGSDHCPLILNSGEAPHRATKRFFFEKQWLLQPGFAQRVSSIWIQLGIVPLTSMALYAMLWTFATLCAHRHLRGWGTNVGSHLKARKEALMSEVSALDTKADLSGLTQEEWARRYTVEDEMIFILTCKEIYWKQRGQKNWVLKGDASTQFFHAVANGRRRRCMIHVLRDGDNVITEDGALQTHIYAFYRELLGSSGVGSTSLHDSIWDNERLVSEADNPSSLGLSRLMRSQKT